MSALKDQVAEMIQQLPADATLEDIQYHLYVLEKVRKGQDDIKNGRRFTHDEARVRLRKWLTR